MLHAAGVFGFNEHLDPGMAVELGGYVVFLVVVVRLTCQEARWRHPGDDTLNVRLALDDLLASLVKPGHCLLTLDHHCGDCRPHKVHEVRGCWVVIPWPYEVVDSDVVVNHVAYSGALGHTIGCGHHAALGHAAVDAVGQPSLAVAVLVGLGLLHCLRCHLGHSPVNVVHLGAVGKVHSGPAHLVPQHCGEVLQARAATVQRYGQLAAHVACTEPLSVLKAPRQELHRVVSIQPALVLDGVVSKRQQQLGLVHVPIRALLRGGLVEAPQVGPVVEEPLVGRGLVQPLALSELEHALLHIAALRADALRQRVHSAPAVAEVHEVQGRVVHVLAGSAQCRGEPLLGCALQLGCSVPRSHRGLPVQELLLLLGCAFLVPDAVEPRGRRGLALGLTKHNLAHVAHATDLLNHIEHAGVDLPAHSLQRVEAVEHDGHVVVAQKLTGRAARLHGVRQHAAQGIGVPPALAPRSPGLWGLNARAVSGPDQGEVVLRVLDHVCDLGAQVHTQRWPTPWAGLG